MTGTMLLAHCFCPFVVFSQIDEASLSFARIQETRDWIIPLLILFLLVYWSYRQYAKETGILKNWQFVTLFGCRVLFLLVLLFCYLDPKWEYLQSFSRIAVLVDTSGSMARVDQGKDGFSVQTRFEQVQSWLEKTAFLQFLHEEHDLSVYRFDRELVLVEATGQTESLHSETLKTVQADGMETRLGEAILDLLQREKDSALTGIVLISDGGHNAGQTPESALELLQTLQIPIHTIGVGSRKQPVSLRFSDIQVPKRAFAGDPFWVKCMVEQLGGDQEYQTCTVELWLNTASETSDPGTDSGIKIGQKELQVQTNDVQEVAFEVNPSQPEKYYLTFKLITEVMPQNAGDHVQQGGVEIVEHRDRILLFAGGPVRDYQFLCSQLSRDNSVQIDAYLPWTDEGVSQSVHQQLATFPETMGEMSQYDCVVAFDPDWRTLSPEQIDILESWVAREGGGLVVVAGPVYLMDTITGWTTDPKMEKILALYPVDVSLRKVSTSLKFQVEAQPQPLHWMEAGEMAEFLRPADSELESRAIWGEFPGFYSTFIVNGLKPSAVLYAQTRTDLSSNREKNSDSFAANRPLSAIFVEQFYGSGRVFYIGSSELWRLRKWDSACFDRLYTKIIRHTSQGRLQNRSDGILFSTDKKRYVLGETAILRVSLQDTVFRQSEPDDLILAVLSPDSQVRQIKLLADSSVPGTFSTILPLTKEGTWTLKLPASENRELVETIQVQMSEREQEQICQNAVLLEKIARKTGGQFHDLVNDLAEMDNTTDLLERLKVYTQRTVLDESAQERTFWGLLCVLCGLLCLEWLFRRLVQLM